MNMHEPGYDYFEPSEFDQQVDEFKEALRCSVKEEITKEISDLRATVKEQGERLKNLTALERETEQKRIEYEHKLRRVEWEAEDKVRKEGIRKLLTVLAEPRFALKREYIQGPKCDKCDGNRRLRFTTARGQENTEACFCADSTPHWVVEEMLVQEVSKRHGKLLVWYSDTSRYIDQSEDTFRQSNVLKPADGVAIEDLKKEPTDYGYTSAEDAQRVADALNKADAEMESQL